MPRRRAHNARLLQSILGGALPRRRAHNARLLQSILGGALPRRRAHNARLLQSILGGALPRRRAHNARLLQSILGGALPRPKYFSRSERAFSSAHTGKRALNGALSHRRKPGGFALKGRCGLSKQPYQASLPFSSGITSSIARMAHSIMPSSGSLVVRRWSCLPGQVTMRETIFASWRPAQRLIS